MTTQIEEKQKLIVPCISHYKQHQRQNLQYAKKELIDAREQLKRTKIRAKEEYKAKIEKAKEEVKYKRKQIQVGKEQIKNPEKSYQKYKEDIKSGWETRFFCVQETEEEYKKELDRQEKEHQRYLNSLGIGNLK